MIRVVVAVVLTLAILAASLPAIDTARERRSASDVTTQLHRLDATASALVDGSDVTPAGVPDARRTVTFHLPERSLTTASVAYVEIGGTGEGRSRNDGGVRISPADRANVVTYELRGKSPTRLVLDGVDFRTPDGPIVFRESGTHRLRLTLSERDGRVVVLVGTLRARTTAPYVEVPEGDHRPP